MGTLKVSLGSLVKKKTIASDEKTKDIVAVNDSRDYKMGLNLLGTYSSGDSSDET